MLCNGCGNDKAYKTISVDDFEYCDRCGEFSSRALPDVYWDGKPEHGLADDPVTGKPRVFSSKMEKARYLKERGLVEGWAKNPTDVRKNGREEAISALKEVSKWGKDYRRQQFLRIKRGSESFT